MNTPRISVVVPFYNNADVLGDCLAFDFAVTGRPMLFFTYDLASYRDKLRGFYFDFEAEAPGPLLATSAEVLAAVAGADDIAAGYRDSYQAFAAKVLPPG